MPIIATALKKILNYLLKESTHIPTMRINLAQKISSPQPKPIKESAQVPLIRINLIQKDQMNKPSPLFPLLLRKTAKLFNEKERKIDRLATRLKTAQAANWELRIKIADLKIENEKFATLNEYLLDKNLSEEITNALRAKQEEREKLRAMGEVKVLNQEKQQLIQDHNKLVKKIKVLESDLKEQNQLFLDFLDSNSCSYYGTTAKLEIGQLRRKIQILESNRKRILI